MMHKLYPIDQSPLYAIVGLKQLETRLNIKLSRIDKLINPDSFRVWPNAKGREIQHPVGWLADVHKRIARFMSHIETPDYVHSKKSRSYITNANEHKGFHPVAKTDISSFYPNTNRQMVKDMFVQHFKCAKDVAGLLADICCYKQLHIPTGSALSGYVAFFANKNLFDQVHEKAKQKGCVFTLYVDDLTFSGSAASKGLINEVSKIINQNGMANKPEKTQTFSSAAPKLITGVVVRGNKILLPNVRHKEIDVVRNAISNSSDEIEKHSLKLSLKGRMLEALQIQKVDSGMQDEFPALIYSS